MCNGLFANGLLSGVIPENATYGVSHPKNYLKLLRVAGDELRRNILNVFRPPIRRRC